jgi:hypothetical protein
MPVQTGKVDKFCGKPGNGQLYMQVKRESKRKKAQLNEVRSSCFKV